jgi:hypothetical protein
MAILTGTQQNYYEGENYGSYQFVSLKDIINQFMIAYVGEEKVISKARRTDVVFHAKRALAELSFDTFKSFKSQEIVLPPSLTMILPHDYVNYTKISWSDDSGIKHNLYPASKTSNPFKVKQDEDGNYDFVTTSGVVDSLKNSDFSSALVSASDWTKTPAANNANNPPGNTTLGNDVVGVVNEVLTFTSEAFNYQGTATGRAYACWQEINVANMDLLDLQADGLSAAAQTNAEQGVLRVGISSTPGDPSTNLLKANPSLNDKVSNPGENNAPNFLLADDGTNGLAYVEWSDGTTVTTTTTKSVLNIDVSAFNSVYVLITSFTPMTEVLATPTTVPTSLTSTNTIDNIVVTYEGASPDLIQDGDSTTWSNYKSDNNVDNIDSPEIYSYDTDIYDFNIGQRYGLEPSHAQSNGSFYIDDLKGLIHFSSNISGKTVILDYISDTLGTNAEMKVHKFAEEAMYKSIAHAVLSTRANTPEYIINRYKKEKRSAVRQAKLRLSNIKLEDITQVLRGKSKHIKH